MKTEPGLTRATLVAVLREHYGLDTAELKFLPKGFATYCYVASCQSGERRFLKLYDPASPEPTAGRPDFHLDVMWELVQGGCFRQLPCPIRTNDGALSISCDRFQLVVFDYLLGQTLDEAEPWPDAVRTTLARAVGAIHGCTAQLGISIPRVEQFDFPFAQQLLEGMDELVAIRPRHASNRESLAVSLPQRAELLARLDRLAELGRAAQRARSPFVLCHTDLWGGNLLLGEDGELYVLDWEGVRLAPPEQDLFVFTADEDFERFLDHYEAAFQPVSLSAETFGFYYYRRNLEDLADYVVRLSQRDDAEQDVDSLEGIASLVVEWPSLEPKIMNVRTKLVRRAANR